jgi:hypothetical protein
MPDFVGVNRPITYYTTPGEGGDAVGVDWSFFTDFINRTWYPAGSRFVFWTTPDSPDSTGTQYPGPGVFGVDTAGYAYIAPAAGQ